MYTRYRTRFRYNPYNCTTHLNLKPTDITTNFLGSRTDHYSEPLMDTNHMHYMPAFGTCGVESAGESGVNIRSNSEEDIVY